MINSQNLIKKIRKESGLTQGQLADILKVSKILIAMVETGQKPISKQMISKLSDVLEISSFSLEFSLFSRKEKSENILLSPIELRLLKIGEKLQEQLVIQGAKKLKKYVK